MKKRVILIVYFILLIGILLIGLNTVFSVAAVKIDFSLATAVGTSEANKLKTELEDQYLGRSIFFITEGGVKDKSEAYTYLNVTSVEKKFPNVLLVGVEENVEVFAFNQGDAFVMTDADGLVLRTASANANNADGKENFLFENFVNDDGTQKEYYSAAWDCAVQLNALTGGIRTCFSKVCLVQRSTNERADELTFYTLEGVTLTVVNPAQNAVNKVRSAFSKYLSLTTEQKLKGSVYAVDSTVQEGDISVSYLG